ncbi:MAG TPA: HD-GYP domain-containing protein [Chloroflexota bacterium]|jgi:HD-GYP domain-containing protein (c-di-GMP phosphodiesterase class II)
MPAGRQDELAELARRFEQAYGQALHYARDVNRLYAAERERAQEIEAALAELRETHDAVVGALVGLLDIRDQETEGHSQRVAALSAAIGGALDLSADDLAELHRGALLHDIGKVGVPDAVLRKAGPLTAAEWAEMRRHPEMGHRILRGIPSLARAAAVVLQHHERYDGRGYPARLRGEAIALGARIFAVADAFDAMTSARPYRPALDRAAALAEIARQRGRQFDPAVVDAFLAVVGREAGSPAPDGGGSGGAGDAVPDRA